MSVLQQPPDYRINNEGIEESKLPNVSSNMNKIGSRFSASIWTPPIEEDDDDMDIPDEISNRKLPFYLIFRFIFIENLLVFMIFSQKICQITILFKI